MAYRQKSKDISGLMMKMKSPLNYGGDSVQKKSALMNNGGGGGKCTPGGSTECVSPGEAKSRRLKGRKQRGSDKPNKSKGSTYTIEHEKGFKQPDPGFEVAYLQDAAGRSTGWRESEGKSPEEFVKETEATNIVKSDRGQELASLIDRPSDTPEQLWHRTTQTKKNKKGKTKLQIKRTGTESYDTRTRPESLVYKKDRTFGKDKYRSYTTNVEHASKQNKLVSEKKMRKINERMQKKLHRGSPKLVDKKYTNDKNKKSSIMGGMM